MNCDEFRNVVFELTAGELDEKTAEAARAHMAECPGCRKEYEAVQELAASLREMGDQKAPADLLPNVMGRIRDEKARSRFNLIRFGTAAAAVVLAVGAVKVLPGIVKDPNNLHGSESTVRETQDDGGNTVEDIPALASENGGEAVDSGASAETAVDQDTVVSAPEGQALNDNQSDLAAVSGKMSARPETEQDTAGTASARKSSESAPPAQNTAETPTENVKPADDGGRENRSANYTAGGQGTTPVQIVPENVVPAGTEQATADNTATEVRTNEQTEKTGESDFGEMMLTELDGEAAAAEEIADSTADTGAAEKSGKNGKETSPDNWLSEIFGGIKSSGSSDSGSGKGFVGGSGRSSSESSGGSGGNSAASGSNGGTPDTAVTKKSNSGNDEGLQIITAGLGDSEPIVDVPRSYIHRRVRFSVGAEYAEAVAGISTSGKSMSQVSGELSAAGVKYEVYIIEDDYTSEYSKAGSERRAQIEALCAVDECSISIR